MSGGGHIHGGFLEAGLVDDEVSILLVPGINGRYEILAVFDGINSTKDVPPFPSSQNLSSEEKRDLVWQPLRDDSVQNGQESYEATKDFAPRTSAFPHASA